MFVPFNIKSDTIEYITRNGDYSYDTDRIKERLTANINADTIRQHLIDGTRLQEEWFPSEFYDSQFDVFISHAHRDEKLVKKLAGYLYVKYGLRSFIDSCYWGYANDLLQNLDEYYSAYKRYDGTKAYRYDTSNFMAANVHIMLSMALMKMMDACECLIFVDSDQSLNYQKGKTNGTPSPWIYEEVGFSNRLRVNIPERFKKRVRVIINESRDASCISLECFSASTQREAEFNYTIDMHNFEELGLADFTSIESWQPPTAILDRWYSKYGIHKAFNRLWTTQ